MTDTAAACRRGGLGLSIPLLMTLGSGVVSLGRSDLVLTHPTILGKSPKCEFAKTYKEKRTAPGDTGVCVPSGGSAVISERAGTYQQCDFPTRSQPEQ